MVQEKLNETPIMDSPICKAGKHMSPNGWIHDSILNGHTKIDGWYYPFEKTRWCCTQKHTLYSSWRNDNGTPKTWNWWTTDYLALWFKSLEKMCAFTTFSNSLVSNCTWLSINAWYSMDGFCSLKCPESVIPVVPMPCQLPGWHHPVWSRPKM